MVEYMKVLSAVKGINRLKYTHKHMLLFYMKTISTIHTIYFNQYLSRPELSKNIGFLPQQIRSILNINFLVTMPTSVS